MTNITFVSVYAILYNKNYVLGRYLLKIQFYIIIMYNFFNYWEN